MIVRLDGGALNDQRRTMEGSDKNEVKGRSDGRPVNGHVVCVGQDWSVATPCLRVVIEVTSEHCEERYVESFYLAVALREVCGCKRVHEDEHPAHLTE